MKSAVFVVFVITLMSSRHSVPNPSKYYFIIHSLLETGYCPYVLNCTIVSVQLTGCLKVTQVVLGIIWN